MLKAKISVLVLASLLLVGCNKAPETGSTPAPGAPTTPMTTTTTTTDTTTTMAATPAVTETTVVTTTSTPGMVPGTGTPADRGATVASSTPTEAAQSFITAAAAKDAVAMKSLLAVGAEDEFKPILDGTADDKALTDIAAKFTGATTGTEKIEDEGQEAEVDIAMGDKKEGLELVNTPDGWRVKSF